MLLISLAANRRTDHLNLEFYILFQYMCHVACIIVAMISFSPVFRSTLRRNASKWDECGKNKTNNHSNKMLMHVMRKYKWHSLPQRQSRREKSKFEPSCERIAVLCDFVVAERNCHNFLLAFSRARQCEKSSTLSTLRSQPSVIISHHVGKVQC